MKLFLTNSTFQKKLKKNPSYYLLNLLYLSNSFIHNKNAQWKNHFDKNILLVKRMFFFFLESIKYFTFNKINLNIL